MPANKAPQGEDMKNKSVITRKDMVDGISRFRLDLEDQVDGVSLVNLDIGLGYVLYDLANSIGLTPEEKIQAVGLDIIDQIENVPLDIVIVDNQYKMDAINTWPEMTNDQHLTLGNN